MTRLLRSPDFTREETEVLAEEILRRHGIGVTGARVAARFSRSLRGQPRPGAGPVETKYLRLWPFWLSAHLIAMARRVEAGSGLTLEGVAQVAELAPFSVLARRGIELPLVPKS